MIIERKNSPVMYTMPRKTRRYRRLKRRRTIRRRTIRRPTRRRPTRRRTTRRRPTRRRRGGTGNEDERPDPECCVALARRVHALERKSTHPYRSLQPSAPITRKQHDEMMEDARMRRAEMEENLAWATAKKPTEPRTGMPSRLAHFARSSARQLSSSVAQ